MKFLIALLFPSLVFCQSIDTSFSHLNKKRTLISTADGSFMKRATTEICSNNKDDDNNHLIDNKDFSCYYSSANFDCKPSKIVWVCTNYGLFWIDLETGVQRHVGKMIAMNDIEWASDGKLYGIDDNIGSVWEIDPNTAKTKLIRNATGYTRGNAMGADAAGNLYLAAYSLDFVSHDVIKMNIATGKISVVANLTKYNLTSSGDLTFLNGYLYLTCNDNKLAKIDVGTGVIQFSYIINSPVDRNHGLITLGDGNLYFTSLNQIYKLDPISMQATLVYTFKIPDLDILGAANYSDQCNAPGCRAKVAITIESNEPYCTSPGVLLKARGVGIPGNQNYTWTTPGQGTVIGDTLVATIPGTYAVRYYSIPDACEEVDSVSINIIKSPAIEFGEDTILCKGMSLNLKVHNIQTNTSYIWQNEVASPYYTVTRPGMYSLEASNVCGKASGSVLIRQIEKPVTFIGQDTTICPGAFFSLHNKPDKLEWNENNWSDLSGTDSIMVTGKGIYWLEMVNACGASRDSIIISYKDSCACFPLYPKVQLAPDVEMCMYDTLVLKNLQHREGYLYTWQNGGHSQAFTVKKPGTYWVDVSTYCETKRGTVIITEKKKDVSVPYIYQLLLHRTMIIRMTYSGRW